MTATVIDALLARVARASAPGERWLREQIQLLQPNPDPARLARAFAAAPRQVGRGPLSEAPPLDSKLGAVPTPAWTAGDAGRVALLLAFAAAAGGWRAGVDALYTTADSAEKSAIARALPWLGAEELLPLALDIGRTNEATLFSALALDNPYPAAVYPELEFNKLVLKVTFLKLPLARVLGLSERANPELSRMASDYLQEQRAAGREVAPDLHQLIR